jgi:hypothetical protein
VAGGIPVGVSAAFDGEKVICARVYTESVGQTVFVSIAARADGANGSHAVMLESLVPSTLWQV